jgi:hypothetical protein
MRRLTIGCIALIIALAIIIGALLFVVPARGPLL